jgi:preprotein translocase subunit SecB
MKINIIGNKVTRLSISDFKADESTDQDSSEQIGKADFGAKVIFAEDAFSVVFNIKVCTEDLKVIKVEYESHFKTDIPIDEKFKQGSFPYVNAPAIAYPYLRAFISNLTLNAGYDPVMLTSLNFVAMKDKIKSASI